MHATPTSWSTSGQHSVREGGLKDYCAESSQQEGRDHGSELLRGVIAKHAPRGLDPDGHREPDCEEESQQAGGGTATHAPRDHGQAGVVRLCARARYDSGIKGDERTYDSSGYYDDAMGSGPVGDAIYDCRRYSSGILGIGETNSLGD